MAHTFAAIDRRGCLLLREFVSEYQNGLAASRLSPGPGLVWGRSQFLWEFRTAGVEWGSGTLHQTCPRNAGHDSSHELLNQELTFLPFAPLNYRRAGLRG
jgi:hypothetical protein